MDNNYHAQQQQQDIPAEVQQQQQQQQINDTRLNSAINGTLPTEIRRKYPKDILDRKTEWLAIENHKQDIDQQLRGAEGEIKNYRQKELLTELDRKVLQSLEEKQRLLQQKHQDAVVMQQQREDFNQQQVQNMNNKKVMGAYMNDYINQQANEQRERTHMEKQQKINWENSLLEYNRQKLESEQKRLRDHKQFLTQERIADIERAQQKRDYERGVKNQAALDYQELMKVNAQREITKEENYKNFYKMAADNQNYKHNQHYQNVLRPQYEKQHNLEDIVNKNYDERNKKVAQNELNRIQDLQRENDNIKMTNDNQINYRNHEKDVQKMEMDEKVKNRLSDLEKYKAFLDFKQNEKLNNQNSYKDYLDQQANEKREIQQNQLRMTKAEKGLNKNDLQAFKQFDGGMYSLLPGWQPQIGQLPHRQNRELMQQKIHEQLKKPAGGQTLGQTAGWQKAYANQMQRELAQQQQNTTQQQFQKVGEPIEKFNVSAIYANQNHLVQRNQSEGNLMSNKSALQYGHNPIINPMPFNMQNPYISKEFVKASGNRQASNQGNSSLLQAGGQLTSPK